MDYRERVVSENLDIVTTSEEEYYCRCPFHSDNNPSFAVNKKTGLWICHGCNEKGNWNNLLRRLGINQKFPELQEVSINTIDNIISEITDFLDTPNLDNENKYLDDSFLKKYNFPHNYWSERGLSEETIENFELGYDPLTNAGIIPLRTYNGHLLGVIRRRFDPDANIKYLYPKGFSKASYLFGAHQYSSGGFQNQNMKKLNYSGGLALVEGVGIPALAILGSNFSEIQKVLLTRLNPSYIVLCFDNDKAGKLASASVCDKIDIPVMVSKYKKGWANDPADLQPEQRVELYEEAEMWFDDKEE